MLVLSRRELEAIYVGDAVKITILEIHGRRVRLAIDAPPSIVIDRHELRERKRKESLDITLEAEEPHQEQVAICCSAAVSNMQ